MAERYHLNHPFLLSQSGVTNGHWISFERFRRFSVHVLGMLAGDIVKAFGSNEPTQPAATGGIVFASITADSLIERDTPPTWKQQSKEKKMSITIVPSSNAVVLGDNTTNPMTSNVGAFVLGWDGSDG